MKSKMISVWAVLLLGTSPVWAQKYHDAIVEDSHGPVKMIKSDGKIFSYDSDGRLTTVDNEDAPDTQYDNNGYPLERCSNVCTQYEYNENGQLTSESYETLLGVMVIDYSYNSRGDRVKKATTYSFSLMSVDTYRILRYDDRGNWIEREVLHRSTDDNGKLGNGTVTKETREILYFTPATPTGDSSPAAGTDNSDWASLRESLIGKRITPQSPTSAEGWQALIGKRLSLTTYGISQNGQEANRFECQTGEYIELGSDGVLLWGNRCDGNTSYRYRIDGKRIYLTQISGKETGDKWFELTRQSDGLIKTESNLGTYRYFRIDN
ncbi:hypothetical protein [Barnesiella viscericola]|uniref:hypothetical protein n=1 Tax=Barnesiella viscericola TaxID=397865 RepID=UPI00320925BD